MTTLDELCGVIGGLGIKWTNAEWEPPDDLVAPFIVLRRGRGTTSGANDLTWFNVAEYDIELYTVHRNYELERTITNALDDAGIYFSDGGVWPHPSEGLMEAVITVEVREN